MTKRIVDIIAALALLLLTAPLLLVVAVCIAAESRGGIFFLQRRVGRGGVCFNIIKFRTMVSRAWALGPGLTVQEDPRVTRTGRILRRLGLDELPKLWNILRGDMSFIGPRPQVPLIVKLYTPEQRRVLDVRPGLVSPSLVLGQKVERPAAAELDIQAYYAKAVLPAQLRPDLSYAENPGVLEDIRLLGLGVVRAISSTAKSMMSGQGKSYTTLLPADLLCLGFSFLLAYQLRFDWSIPRQEFEVFVSTLALSFLIRVPVFLYYQLYRTVWKYIGPRDLVRVAQACTASTFLVVSITFLTGYSVASRTVFVIDWICLMFFMALVRILPRFLGVGDASQPHGEQKNALIIGAEDIGEMVVRESLKDRRLAYQFVGFVDESDLKQGTVIHGLKVLGKYADIPALVKQLRIDEVLIAVSNISSRGMKEILHRCEEAKVRHRVVPGVTDLLSGKVHLSKIRDVTVADLLGHRPVELNLSEIRGLLRGKTVLVTGAGGSIGSELCRQVADYEPAQLICVDITENFLADLALDLRSQFKHVKFDFRLCNITDADRVRRTFQECRPDIVFHAAAYKHVPICESHPDQAIINNVRGSCLVAFAAAETGCEHFVMISTDKAVNPTSVLGATKRIAELMVQSLSSFSRTNFVTVRFGNVLHSNGSAIPIFMKQIAKGGPLTITHPDVWRFFMSIPEAVQLVLQAATMGKNGEIFVLDMGRPVRILDLAQELIRRAGLKPYEDIDIVITGLRPGEKLVEELLTDSEQTMPSKHPRINLIRSPIRDYNTVKEQVDQLCQLATESFTAEALLLKMKEIVPEYTPWPTHDSIVEPQLVTQPFLSKEVSSLEQGSAAHA